MKVNEVKVKSVLTPSKLPHSDYVINPYGGCLHGCVYCYADFMRRFTGHTDDKWGDYIDIKINAPEILKEEIIKFKNRHRGQNQEKQVIHFGSVTDAYQTIEAKYKIARQCLEILKNNEIKSEISLLTKSKLITRDIDLLKAISNVNVGLTLTTADEEIRNKIEPKSSSFGDRLNALKELNQAGIKTYAFVGPLIPSVLDNKRALNKLFGEIQKTGTRNIWVELLNPRGGKNRKISKALNKDENEIKFSLTEDQILELINQTAKSYNLNLVKETLVH